MDIRENFSLRSFNTFRIDAKARFFSAFSGTEQLQMLADRFEGLPTLILGGGSNILLEGDFDGAVLKNGITGITKVREDEQNVYVRAGAGENWHRFVLHCIEKNWAGVENLSLIPGQVGASPMQNIGAYGVEIKDVFHELEAMHLRERSLHRFAIADCAFNYRDSVFKNKLKGQFVILNVTYRLSKIPHFNTSYGAISGQLEKMGVKNLTLAAVSEAVIAIRQSKLPDPEEVGNAGSFFKNPSVSAKAFQILVERFPSIVGYKNSDGSVKLAAGWLIEQCGWKGYRKGDAGCHNRQALVLVNYGHATGSQVNELANEIADSVKEKFGVALEKEVNIV